MSIHLGTDAAFPVDTHVQRLSHRLGFSRQRDPDKVELDLRALVPAELWTKGHQLLIWHGRRTCIARAPACERCVVGELCPRIGVARGKRGEDVAGRRAPTGRRRTRGPRPGPP